MNTPGDSRAAIDEAARALFAVRGFDQVTIRDIAAAAGVSPALVMKLCGTKRELFLATATITAPPLPQVPRDRLGAALVDQLVERLEREVPDHLARAVMLQLTGPEPDEVRTRFLAEYVAPLAAVLDGPRARLRAELVVAALSGLATTLRLFTAPEATGALAEVRASYGRAVQVLLDGD
ncbi:TetR family transcriptional regulator [Nocardioides sp. zg-ZUI104]|uniref:TetR/AcrR family transcriptional regulator n=1 Tax=Nocardioides faecalis TaxID=2803858 RepID=UPI001BCCFD7D|nr:TetR/AcrR family transcriptional regulator [Nocardioides faecalis]MBS4753351.1 TetR family transcriptional regulator [Nocardioides faecalis]